MFRSATALVLAATAALVTPSAAATAPAGTVPAPSSTVRDADVLSVKRAFAAAHRLAPASPVPGVSAPSPEAAAQPEGQVDGRSEMAASSSVDGCVRDRQSEPRDTHVLDLSSTYLSRCDGSPVFYNLHAHTYDQWANETLYALLISMDTDLDASTGCDGDDFFVIGYHDTAAGLIADVGKTPSCDDATWTYRGEAWIDRGSADRDRDDLARMNWDATQIDSPRAVRYYVDTSDGSSLDTAPDNGTYSASPDPKDYPTPVAREIGDTCDTQVGTPFVDAVGTTHGYSINCASGRRITSGKTAVTYEPDGTLTRGQTATFLVNTMRAGGFQPTPTQRLCREDDVHADNMSLLIESGVIPRTKDDVCDPTSLIDRALMALWTRNTLVSVAALDTGAPTMDWYSDDEPSEFESQINEITSLGIVTGKGGTLYGPDESLTRGQMATFLVRSLDAIRE